MSQVIDPTDIQNLHDLSLRVTWLRRLKLYQKTVEAAIDAQQNLFQQNMFDRRPAPHSSLRTCRFIRDEEVSIFGPFLDEGSFSNNPLAALITLSCNTEVASFRDHFLYPSATGAPEAMVDQLRKRGDIGTALLLQEILLLDKRNKPNKEISAVELRKYRDIYLQSTERLKMITGHEVPAVPPLHNLLLLTQGEVMFPSDLAQTSLEDYVGRSLLHLALDLGVMEDEPRYIEFDVTTTTLRDDWNRLPIHIACSRDSETVVEYLLNINVNLDVVDGNRRSALHYAAASGDEGIIQLLLERDANIDYKDAYGLSPLVWAAIRGHTTTVQVLAQDGVDLDVHVNRHYQMPLFLAAKKGYRDVIELLLEKGADVNSQDSCGNTPLIEAANEGHRDVVELLLEKGADVNFKNVLGNTPLFGAARWGHISVVQLLLEKGADVILKTQYSNTPLSIAIIRRHAIIVQLLLEKGAKVNLEDMDDDLYFFAAAEYGYTNVLRQLLERNSDFRYVFLDKMLRIAARGGHATTVQLLLENGADPNTEMRGHPTALQIAIDEGHKDVAEILRTTASGQHQTQIRDARAGNLSIS